MLFALKRMPSAPKGGVTAPKGWPSAPKGGVTAPKEEVSALKDLSAPNNTPPLAKNGR